jgi:photosystem II stability/assembly factor-like uncharacterized protein
MSLRATLVLAVASTIAALALPVQTRPPDDVQASSAAERQQSWEQHVQLKAGSEFRSLPWRPIGPAFQGGRIESIAIHPSRPDTWFVGAGSGSVWRTVNAGLTWTAVFENQPTFTIGEIAIAPSNPDVVWVGTGEVLMARSSFAGAGVFKSTDDGRSWRSMGLADTHHIARIVIDPHNADVVYVAGIGRNYGPNAERGVFRTTDGGRSWQKTLHVDERTGAIDLVMHPHDPRTLFAIMWEHDRRAWNNLSNGPGSGLYKSSDGGTTWKKVTEGLPAGPHIGRMGLAFARSQPSVMYLLVSNETPLPTAADVHTVPSERLNQLTTADLLKLPPDAFEETLRSSGLPRRYTAESVRRRLETGAVTPESIAKWLAARTPARSATVGGELYRSTNGGTSWRKMNEGPIGTAIGYDFCLVRVSPDNPDEIYILGNWLRRSRDGGKTYETVGGSVVHLFPHGGRMLHLDHHELVIDPSNANHLFLGSDGGLYVSRDRGGSWFHLNNLPIAEFYAIDTDNRTPYRVYGGTQDDGALFGVPERFRYDAPGDWQHVYLDSWAGGDSYATEPDPLDPDVVYFEHQFGDLRRKNMRTGATVSIQPQEDIGEAMLRYNWMTPFFVSQYNPLTVYYGANRLFKSVDRGDHWMPVSPDLTTAPGPERTGNVPFGTITTLSESPLQPGLILVGTDDGKVQYTRDDGRTWVDVSAGLPGKWVSRVVASAHDLLTFYATLTGYREDDVRTYVFRSTDGGRHWVSLAANLPSEPVNVIREDPRNANVLYLGTDLGAYVSLDRGGTWQALGGNLPTAAVHDLVVQPREDEIVIGTHGLSAFVLDARPIQQMTAAIRDADFHLFDPRPVSLGRNAADNEPVPQDRSTEATFVYYVRTAGDVTIAISDDKGQSVRTLRVSGTTGVNAATWDLRSMPASSRSEADRRDVAPGTYRVSATFGSRREETTLSVLPSRRALPAASAGK